MFFVFYLYIFRCWIFGFYGGLGYGVIMEIRGIRVVAVFGRKGGYSRGSEVVRGFRVRVVIGFWDYIRLFG